MRVDATELACPSAVCRRVPPDHHQHPFDPCPTRARVVFHSDHFGRGRGVQARARCSKTRCRSSADGRQVEGVVWQTPSPRQASCGATGLFVRGACECGGVGKTPGTVSRGNYRKRMKVPRCVGTPPSLLSLSCRSHKLCGNEFAPAQLKHRSRTDPSPGDMGLGRGRSRGARLCALAWSCIALSAAVAQPATPPPAPLAPTQRSEVMSSMFVRRELDPIAAPTDNATDAALAAAVGTASLGGIPGFLQVQCGGAQSSATLNGSAFGVANLTAVFGAAGGSSVGPWPTDRQCPASAPACGQAPVPPNWPPTIKSTDCWLCGGGDVAAAYRQQGDITLQRGTRCLTTSRARAATGWARSVDGVDTGGPPPFDGLLDERHSGVDWRCVGDAAHWFYWGQASGPLSDAARARVGEWHGDTLTKDRAPNGAPLVGSFLDAADASKFVFPLAYTLSMLSYGGFVGAARDAYKVDPVRRADLRAIINHGARFVRAARYAPDSIVAYTTAPGDLNASHAGFWGRAEDITVPSNVGYLTPGKPSADIAGAMAAALAGAAYVNVDDDSPTADELEAAASYVAVAADLFEQVREEKGLWGVRASERHNVSFRRPSHPHTNHHPHTTHTPPHTLTPTTTTSPSRAPNTLASTPPTSTTRCPCSTTHPPTTTTWPSPPPGWPSWLAAPTGRASCGRGTAVWAGRAVTMRLKRPTLRHAPPRWRWRRGHRRRGPPWSTGMRPWATWTLFIHRIKRKTIC